jgi:hypothetical protein
MSQSNSNDSSGSLTDAKNLLGFLVAGFAGVLNVIGIKSAEIGVLLRNEPVKISVVSAFLLAGVITAALSIFVKNEKYAIPDLVALIVLILTVLIFAVTVWMIPSPLAGQSTERKASLIVTKILIWYAVTLIVIACVRRRRMGRKLRGMVPELFDLQCLLLVAAIVFTSAAAYGALRMETISQTITVAEIGDSLQAHGRVDTLVISLSASKLSTQEWLSLNVMAMPRKWHIRSRCHTPEVLSFKRNNRRLIKVSCAQEPCYYFDNAPRTRHCVVLSEDVIPPDSVGAVVQTIDVPLSPGRFQHVQITAVTCKPSEKAHKPKGTCAPIANASSRLDIAIPR